MDTFFFHFFCQTNVSVFIAPVSLKLRLCKPRTSPRVEVTAGGGDCSDSPTPSLGIAFAWLHRPRRHHCPAVFVHFFLCRQKQHPGGAARGRPQHEVAISSSRPDGRRGVRASYRAGARKINKPNKELYLDRRTTEGGMGGVLLQTHAVVFTTSLFDDTTSLFGDKHALRVATTKIAWHHCGTPTTAAIPAIATACPE